MLRLLIFLLIASVAVGGEIEGWRVARFLSTQPLTEETKSEVIALAKQTQSVYRFVLEIEKSGKFVGSRDGVIEAFIGHHVLNEIARKWWEEKSAAEQELASVTSDRDRYKALAGQLRLEVIQAEQRAATPPPVIPAFDTGAIERMAESARQDRQFSEHLRALRRVGQAQAWQANQWNWQMNTLNNSLNNLNYEMQRMNNQPVLLPPPTYPRPLPYTGR